MYKFMFTSARGKLVYFILITLVAINSSSDFNQQQLRPTYRTRPNFPQPALVPIENAVRINNDTAPVTRYRAQNDFAPQRYEGQNMRRLPIPSRYAGSRLPQNSSSSNKVPLRFRYMKKLAGRPIYQLMPTNVQNTESVKPNPYRRVVRQQMPGMDPTSVIDTFVMITQSEVLQPARKDEDPNSKNGMNQVLESRMDTMEFRRNFNNQRGQNFSRTNKDEDGMNGNIRQNSYMSQANILLPGSKVNKEDGDSVKPTILQNTYISHADLSLPSPSASRTRFDGNEDTNLRQALVRPNSQAPQVNPPGKSPYYEEVRNTDASNRAYDRGNSGNVYMNLNDSEKGLNALIHDNMMKLRAFINSEIERKENGSSYQVFPDRS